MHLAQQVLIHPNVLTTNVNEYENSINFVLNDMKVTLRATGSVISIFRLLTLCPWGHSLCERVLTGQSPSR